MTTDTQPLVAIDAEAVVARFGDLATLAPVAVEVLRLADDDRAGLDDIAEVISRDPGLASQLLRMSNSSLYGLGGEVTSLTRAATVLGLRTVRLLSLSFSVIAKVEAGADDALIWRRTLAGSALAQKLASEYEPRLADECFISSLLSNMGRVALLAEPAYADANVAAGGWLDPIAEHALFGITGDDTTAMILLGWGLPDVLGEAIANRRAPGALEGPAARIAAILAVADGAAQFITSTEETAPAALDKYREQAHDLLSIGGDAAEELLVDSQPALEEVAAMFKASTPHDAPVTDLLLRARTSLTRMSLDVVAALSQEQTRADKLADENLRLASEASTDALTNLANRRAFDERLETDMAARNRHSRLGTVGLLIMDLDHFKAVNDTWGHQVGDDVLREIGSRLGRYSRLDEFVARIGGEEFGVILPTTDVDEIELAAERFRRSIATEPVTTGAGQLEITVSIGGVVAAEAASTTPGVLYERADSALYEAKHAGRNRVCIKTFAQ